MSSEDRQRGLGGTKVLEVTKRNPITGHPQGRIRTEVATDAHERSVDESGVVDPDTGRPVEVSHQPPARVGGITAVRLEESAAGGTAGIDLSQPAGDRD